MVLRYHLGHSLLPLGPVAVVLESLWVPAVGLFPLIFLFFPDGRLPSQRWRWVFRTYLGLITLATLFALVPAIGAVVHHDIRVNAGGNLTGPSQKSGAAASAASSLLVISIGLMWLSFVVQKFVSSGSAVQRIVDRRFNRAHYDAEATVAALTGRLRDAVDLETVRSELLEVVNRAVEPAHASVWIRRRE